MRIFSIFFLTLSVVSPAFILVGCVQENGVAAEAPSYDVVINSEEISENNVSADIGISPTSESIPTPAPALDTEPSPVLPVPEYTPEPIPTPAPRQDTESPPVLLVTNDTVHFGGRDWRILAREGNYALIIAKDIISRREFHHTLESEIPVTWETSDMRRYLNEYFYNKFSEEERARIRETMVINSENLHPRELGGNDTTDKLFLLSIDEVYRYLEDHHDRMTQCRWGLEVSWWLRSIYSGERSAAANIFHDHGGIYGYFNFTGRGPGSGVRPALWLNLEP